MTPSPETKYPSSAIGRDILKVVPTGSPKDSVSAMLRKLNQGAKKWDTVNYIYVVNAKRQPVGVLSIKELLRAPKRQKLADAAKSQVVTAHPYTRQERAVMLAIRNDIKQLPVVDRRGVLLGVYGSDAVIDTLHEQHVEDILYFSGVTPIQGQIRTILKARVARLAWLRAPWLLVGLLGGVATTFIISYFESALQEIIALAFFIPVIVYMGDAVGHQTQLIFIRSLGSGELKLRTYLWREIAVDLIIGLIAALGLMALVIFWLDSEVAAAIVGLTMFINIGKAGIIALGIPLLLYKLKKDPALGSGPFTTTVQDLLSIVIYFLIAAAFLG